jgi:hypothetical protein
MPIFIHLFILYGRISGLGVLTNDEEHCTARPNTYALFYYTRTHLLHGQSGFIRAHYKQCGACSIACNVTQSRGPAHVFSFALS